MKIGVAGKIMDAATARRCLEHGADFVTIGRAAILHHDFPERVRANPDFAAMPLPVSAEHLRAEGLGPAFVGYMKTWKGSSPTTPAPPDAELRRSSGSGRSRP